MTDKSLSSDSAPGRGRDFAWILVAYAAALMTAGLVVVLLPELNLWWQVFWADLAATVVIFGFSQVFKNSSFYDAYWSVAPPVILLFWQVSLAQWDLRSLMAMLLVWAWAVRLTHNWARGWQGLGHVDWRYVDLKAKTGPWFFLVDLGGIHILPTLWVIFGCLPLWLMLSAGSAPLGGWDLVWPVVGAVAVYFEFRADNVLRQHRLSGVGGVLDRDLWSLCRHPNYLGELGFWLALAMAGFVATGSSWAWLGFVGLLILFVGISIPMIEQRQVENKPAYADYQQRTPCLLPWRLNLWRP